MKITVSSGLSPHSHNPTRKPLFSLDPTVFDPVGEEPDQRQAGRDGQSLKIVRLSRPVLGYERHSGIEPGETGESTADEAGQRNSVEGRTKADNEGQNGRCNPE